MRPLTRTHVRLLGPCFKTGRVVHWNGFDTAREAAPQRGSSSSTQRPSQGSQDMSPEVSLAARLTTVPNQSMMRQGAEWSTRYQSNRAIDVPKQRVAAFYYGGKYARQQRRWDRGAPKEASSTPVKEQSTPQGSTTWIKCLKPLKQPLPTSWIPTTSNFKVPPVWLLTVSRTLELSLQSSFQLSLTVLVRYRSRGHI